MRITNHPILSKQKGDKITIYHHGAPIEAIKGDTVASALMASGVRVMRLTANRREPRGIFCAIGRCTDCMMIIDGVPNTRSCITPVHHGMKTERQEGLAAIREECPRHE